MEKLVCNKRDSNQEVIEGALAIREQLVINYGEHLEISINSEK